MLLAISGCQATSALDAGLPKGKVVIEPMPISVEIGGSKYHLDGVMVRRSEATALPLAILTHGSCGKACRKRRSPSALKEQAMVFAGWGYAAYILMRRDNGKSDGPYAEGFGGCNVQNYERAAEASADDLLAAIQVLKRLPYIDEERIVAIGQSGGGIGVLALAGRMPPGLRAVINFAGGRGGSCIERGKFDESRIRDAFASIGRRARIPTLWLYTENDDLWGAQRPRLWHRAFTGSGGSAKYVLLPPFGRKGHTFFYRAAAIGIWRPVVSDFLN